MKRLAIVAMAALMGMLVARASYAYCGNFQNNCGSGFHRVICCNDPTAGGPPPALPDPNNPPSGIEICGAIDELVGGCVNLPSLAPAAGCVAGIGLDLGAGPTVPDPNGIGTPPNNCGNLAASACSECGCANAGPCVAN